MSEDRAPFDHQYPPPAAAVDQAMAAAAVELLRQAEHSGCTTDIDDGGQIAQVDGSFELRPLVEAILEAARMKP